MNSDVTINFVVPEYLILLLVKTIETICSSFQADFPAVTQCKQFRNYLEFKQSKKFDTKMSEIVIMSYKLVRNGDSASVNNKLSVFCSNFTRESSMSGIVFEQINL
jgi:hypothetical protein